MTDHIRCQIQYQKGFRNYAETLVTDVKPIIEMEEVDDFYFFWQDYSEKFDRHIQLDLIVNSEVDVENFKQKVNNELESKNRSYYWEKEFVDTWYALTQKESDILLKSRFKNAEVALETLEAYLDEELERSPKQLVARNYHLMANQHGMTHLDEFKFCLKRVIEIPIIQLTHRLGIGFVYDKLFLRELD